MVVRLTCQCYYQDIPRERTKIKSKGFQCKSYRPIACGGVSSAIQQQTMEGIFFVFLLLLLLLLEIHFTKINKIKTNFTITHDDGNKVATPTSSPSRARTASEDLTDWVWWFISLRPRVFFFSCACWLDVSPPPSFHYCRTPLANLFELLAGLSRRE